MPKFKQPISLQKLAFDSVIEFTVYCCDLRSVEGSLTELRQTIAAVKSYVSDHIPGTLFMEFCRGFLDDFYLIGRNRPNERPGDHNSAALEIIMDVHFVGLICEGDIQHYMNPDYVHRIQGLKTLDWSELQHHPLVPRALENYNLQDLTTFIYPRICADHDLEIIGPCCSKLEILKIQESKDVTDIGLSALSPCSRLRIINLHYCSVSDNGINELLNVHKRLEEFNVGNLLEAMPKLKQPIPLKNISMDVLVTFLANRCDQLSAGECLDKLRQLVADIEREICPNIPWNSSAEFYNKFLEEFENLRQLRLVLFPYAHQRAVLEIILDKKIAGLKCENPIMAALDISDAHRLRGLRLLNLSYFCFSLPLKLENFQLRDLTTFVYTKDCTDENLKVIGLNCPNLVFLDVANSELVTDRGLRRLNPCSNLRFVFLSFCRISYSGISELLSVNTKIEKLSAWTNSGRNGFDCFSQPDSEVYESISKFTVVLDRVSDEHLRSVVAKFPNLTSLGISGYLAGDLCVLKSLRNLTRLDFSEASGFSWDILKGLLPLTEGRISDLRTCCLSESTACVIQSDLNFLFQTCSNIEHLEIDYRARFDREILVIPPFTKLKYLDCRIPPEYRRRKAALEFGEMLELESLTIDRFRISVDTVISMILDNDRFPNLKVMKVSELPRGFHATFDINTFARDNNLDFEIIEI